MLYQYNTWSHTKWAQGDKESIMYMVNINLAWFALSATEQCDKGLEKTAPLFSSH